MHFICIIIFSPYDYIFTYFHALVTARVQLYGFLVGFMFHNGPVASSALDQQMQACLIATHEAGGVVNSEVAIAAVGIVWKKDSNLLAQNGGHSILTRDWARSLLGRMGFIKRKANTKAKLAVADFIELKSQFINDIRTFKDLEEVPYCFILNWDQTAIKYVLVAEWTMEKQGSKKVKIAGWIFGTTTCIQGNDSSLLANTEVSRFMAHHIHT